MLRALATSLLVVLVVGLGSVAGYAAGSTVTVADYAFSPSTVSVTAGDTVTWTNNGPSGHTITADDASYTSSTLTPGATFSHIYPAPGTYTYHCNIHPTMKATIVVSAPQQPTSTVTTLSPATTTSEAQAPTTSTTAAVSVPAVTTTLPTRPTVVAVTAHPLTVAVRAATPASAELAHTGSSRAPFIAAGGLALTLLGEWRRRAGRRALH